MKIRSSDYLLLRFADAAAPLLRWLGNLESSFFREELDGIAISQPVFITGLARSGTTILLEQIAAQKDVATHRYRDFPFLSIPCLWNKYLDMIGVQDQAVERAHRDRIRVTAESPEAYEEPIWQSFFPRVHDPHAIHLLGPPDRCARFDTFFRWHLKKVIHLRGGRRYVSKGNYNLARLEYLLDLFPDAKFIIPVRHPLTQVQSLVRMHQLFTEYAEQDPRVPRYLASAGHYEFGPQRVPIRLSHEGGDRVQAAWEDGDEYSGYAIQWAEVYRYIDALRKRGDQLSLNLIVVRYEDLCDEPDAELARILAHAGIRPDGTTELKSLQKISPSPHGAESLAADDQATIWRETEAVAQRYGYQASDR